jgi:hypothetical protein
VKDFLNIFTKKHRIHTGYTILLCCSRGCMVSAGQFLFQKLTSSCTVNIMILLSTTPPPTTTRPRPTTTPTPTTATAAAAAAAESQ